MPHRDGLRFRQAGAPDAIAISALHVDSWRRNYRGAYSDSFLDGDVVEDRRAVWTERLRADDGRTHTVVAEDGAELVGFAHVIFNSDATWGALLDNLHVSHGHKRQGVGSQLVARIARAVLNRGTTTLQVWVLEQNVDAQAFYEARGAVRVERAPVSPPGGLASRVNGTPNKLRYAWLDPAALLA